MKSHLQLIPTGPMSREEWLAYRHTGVGASEVGAICGLDDYMSSLELFHYKIGDVPRFDLESMAAFMGKELEDLIAQLWQHWDPLAPTPMLTMMENYRAGTIVRKCRRVNAFIRNPAYPWLYVSLDRLIQKHGTLGEGTLELKSLGYFESDKWVGGLPPKFITQVNTQMLVPEFDYGEMAVLQDGRRFDVFPFTRNDSIIQYVVTKTQDFWERVVKARALVNEKYHPDLRWNQRRLDEIDEEIDKLAPPPDGSLAYDEYLKQKYKAPGAGLRRGTPVELQLALDHAAQRKVVEQAEEHLRELESGLKVALGDHQILDFGPDGKVLWTNTVNGGRIFRNKIVAV